MTKPRLRLAPQDREPTKAEIAMAQIDQSHREWRSPWADLSKDEWKPIETKAQNVLDVDSVLNKWRVVADSQPGMIRRLLRWLRRVG